jgi:hypothetical protein
MSGHDHAIKQLARAPPCPAGLASMQAFRGIVPRPGVLIAAPWTPG